MQFPSKYLENAVISFSKLPGIGKKTALRLVLHLLNLSNEEVNQFGAAVVDLKSKIKYCESCHNICEEELCNICSNSNRNSLIICVVESIRNVIAIESTNQYNGIYHVLGGVISPIDGVGPENLNLNTLFNKVSKGSVKEIIMALNPTMEGDTTIYYISKKLNDSQVKISSLARGIAFGSELEYSDELTLAKSLKSRLPIKDFLEKNQNN